jgi:hypothetical protein
MTALGRPLPLRARSDRPIEKRSFPCKATVSRW